MKSLSFTILFFMLSAVAMAQKRGVIVNMADGVPVRDVKIYTNTNQIFQTNWRGEYSISKPFTSATIVHPSYVSLTLNLYEMGDTIQLLPKYHSLDEVVVYGNAPKPFVPNKSFNVDIFQKPSGLDILSLFRKHTGLSKEQKEKHDEIIKTY